MVTSERIPISPAVLEWARKSISLSIEDAAKRLGISEDTLRKWEAGDLKPTIVQLRKAAEKYKRPLGVLLLQEPPLAFDAMRDFRRMALSSAPWSPELHGEFRRAIDQREVFLELTEIATNSLPTTKPVPVLALGGDVEVAGAALRHFLGVPVARQMNWGDRYEALNAWIAAVEEKGILVIHTRDVSVDEMRAFSISEWPYPVIALNGSDFPRARTFSLMHELAHLCINSGGLCDLHEQDHRESDDLEHFCNQVAAAALLPREVLLQQPSVAGATTSHGWTLDELAAIAERFQTSSEALLLRLITLGKATWATYNLRKPELQREYEAIIEDRRRRRQEGHSGANFYRTKARDIGHGYANSILDAFGNRAISARDAADYLDIKYNQLKQLQVELR